MRADVCVYFSVLNLFSYQTLSKCIHRLSVIVGGGGLVDDIWGFFTINTASRSIRKWPWRHIASLQLSVCLSFRPTLSLFIYVDVYVCALWILLLVSFIILILQSLQWPLNLLFSAFWHLFLFYLLSFLDSLFCYSVVCVVTLNVHTLHTIGRIDECKYSESCIHTYMCIEKQNRMQTRKLNICTSKC